MTTVFICILVGVMMTFTGSSVIYHRWQRRKLESDVPLGEALLGEVGKKLGVERAAAAAGVSTFNVIYNMWRLDGFTLEAINRVHQSHGFDNLGDLIEKTQELIHGKQGQAQSWEGFINLYRGHSAEQVVIENLRNAGHDVSIPDFANQTGYDLLRDGQPFNVKLPTDPSCIHEHLEKYPDIGVITSKEMQAYFPDDPRVIIDPNLSHDQVLAATQDTLGTISEGGSFFDAGDLWMLGICVSAGKNLWQVSEGDKKTGTAMEHVALDAAAIGCSAYMTKTGLAIGLALTPATGGVSAIVVPTVTTALGSIIGYLGGRNVVSWIKERHVRSALENLETPVENRGTRRFGLKLRRP